MDFTDAEPTGARKDGVHFGPGINQKLEENEKKLTNQEDCSKWLQLKASERHLLSNGSIECQVLKYEIKP